MNLVFDNILIDTMNLFYKVFDRDEIEKTLNKKKVYYNSVANFIKSVNDIENKYLKAGGSVYLLFDNHDSRDELQKSFYFYGRKTLYEDYKAGRKQESKAFYYSLDLIKYYFLVKESKYKVLQIQNLEADDLVKPILEWHTKKSDFNLMISNDYDWSRYLTDKTLWLPRLDEEPKDDSDFFAKKGFQPTETNVVVYKALFGDKSDNIPSLEVENKKNYASFVDMILNNEFTDATQVIRYSHHDPNRVRYPFLEKIKELETQFRINVQLISNIKVSESHIELSMCKGRDSKQIVSTIEKALGLKKGETHFEFGIRPPRV
jgi:hypothetical protein